MYQNDLKSKELNNVLEETEIVFDESDLICFDGILNRIEATLLQETLNRCNGNLSEVCRRYGIAKARAAKIRDFNNLKARKKHEAMEAPTSEITLPSTNNNR